MATFFNFNSLAFSQSDWRPDRKQPYAIRIKQRAGEKAQKEKLKIRQHQARPTARRNVVLLLLVRGERVFHILLLLLITTVVGVGCVAQMWRLQKKRPPKLSTSFSATLLLLLVTARRFLCFRFPFLHLWVDIIVIVRA